jgi:murein DD-endopeptidase MepM/ murein hydrolase activator NlpD
MIFLLNISKKLRRPFVAMLGVALLCLTFNLGDMSLYLGANVLGIESHEPFDGTVYPYEKTVDWTALTDSERDMNFEDIKLSKLSSPYKYDEKNLGIDFQDLDFRSAESDMIRNEKITYSVPYLGTYRLDGKAGTGSHAAVDIKMLMRTPIVSIANGLVVDVKDKPSGFGRYVVIRHDNVPSVENPEKLTTYFSSYSHLDEWVVNVGDIVKKGDLIGYNGNTGTSTTPHVHFQIDTADAPFHPYWPFTWQEAQDAGLSFYEAVNSGLGQENGRRYTVNPMDFVQANLNYSVDQEGVVESGDVEVLEDEDAVVKPSNPFVGGEVSILKPSEETTVIDVEEVVKNSSALADIEFETPDVVLLGEEVELVAKLTNDNLLASSSDIENKISSSERADLTYSSRLSSGENTIDFRPRVLGKHTIKAEIDGQTYESEPIDVRLFYDVASDDVDIRMLTALKKADIVQGENGNMNLNDGVNRAASLTFLIRTIEIAKPGIFDDFNNNVEYDFSDVSKGDWFEESVVRSISLGAVDADRSNFAPDKGVNLPELLKMYFEAMGADIDENVRDSYAQYFDVSAWYAPYLQEALNRNIINTDDLVGLDKTMSRREVAMIAYKFLSIIETGRYIY